MCKKVSFYGLLIVCQIVYGIPRQEQLEKFIEEQGEDIKVFRTSFEFPDCIVLKTEDNLKALKEFLDTTQDTEETHNPGSGVWAIPMDYTPEERRKCFFKYSRKASPEDLSLVSEYGVENLRIVDFDSIINGLDRKQDFLCLREIGRFVYDIDCRVNTVHRALKQSAFADNWLNSVVARFTDALVRQKEQEDNAKGIFLDEDSYAGMWRATREFVLTGFEGRNPEVAPSWGIRAFVKSESREIYKNVTLMPENPETGSDSFVEKWMFSCPLKEEEKCFRWYNYLHNWFNELRIGDTHCVMVYKENGEGEELSYMGRFSCLMSPETIENFKKELQNDILDLFMQARKHSCYVTSDYKIDFLFLSLFLLKNIEFPADYAYHAYNRMARRTIALERGPRYPLSLDEEYHEIEREQKSREDHLDELYEFLNVALYDYLGIRWHYSLVGNLGLPLEKGLFGFGMFSSEIDLSLTASEEALRLLLDRWFKYDGIPVEISPKRFYGLAQMSVLMGGSEKIWEDVGFANVDDCIYVNRIKKHGRNYGPRRWRFYDSIDKNIEWFIRNSKVPSLRKLLVGFRCSLAPEKHTEALPEYELWVTWLQLQQGVEDPIKIDRQEVFYYMSGFCLKNRPHPTLY